MLIRTLSCLHRFEGSPLIIIFPQGMEVWETFPSLIGDEVVKCSICISRKYSSEHGVLNKKAEGEGLSVVVIYR